MWALGCDSDSERESRPPSAELRRASQPSAEGSSARARTRHGAPTHGPASSSRVVGEERDGQDGHDGQDEPEGVGADPTNSSGGGAERDEHRDPNAIAAVAAADEDEDEAEADEKDLCDRQCVGGELDGDDLRTPVDRRHGLRPSWSPGDLVALDGPYVIEVGSPPNHLRKAAAEAFVELSDAAYAATGVRINIRSGYRTFALQCSIFRAEVRNLGCAEATRASARAGYSEHQLGTTADLAIGWRRLTGDQPIDAFLDAHAHEYGWILSYPEGAEESTGYKYEPWHYRYIGPDAALDLVRRSTGTRRLSTQEYLAEEAAAGPTRRSDEV